MHIFLALVAAVTFLLACLHVLVAKSAIHEIAAYVLFLTAAVLLSGAGIIEAIHRLRKAVLNAQPGDEQHRLPPGSN